MPAPVLVTGVPRSGTTWVARMLARAPGTSMPGREPMNPRGRQHALAGTLEGWARLTAMTRQQQRALRACYRGWDPRAFSRYGVRRWAAPLPWTRIIVKDPFAMLSIAAVHEATRAVPVLVYRHPAAVLASYRRMGWRADYAEVKALKEFAESSLAPSVVIDEVDAMAAFWSFCNRVALADAARLPEYVVVSHRELASGGDQAIARLAAALDLPGPRGDELPDAPTRVSPPRGVLHDFERDPSDVASSWRRSVEDGEVQRLESLTRDVLEDLRSHRLDLGTGSIS